MGFSLQSLVDQYPDFRFHDLFLGEIADLLRKELSGHIEEFIRVMVRQFRFIDLMRGQLDKTDNNEKLKYAKHAFYSVHLQHKAFNIRFLVHVSPDNSVVCFLVAFYERSGKRKSSYDNYIPTLEKRLADLYKGN